MYTTVLTPIHWSCLQSIDMSHHVTSDSQVSSLFLYAYSPDTFLAGLTDTWDDEEKELILDFFSPCCYRELRHITLAYGMEWRDHATCLRGSSTLNPWTISWICSRITHSSESLWSLWCSSYTPLDSPNYTWIYRRYIAIETSVHWRRTSGSLTIAGYRKIGRRHSLQ
jgi:hypothetical protein